MGVAAYRRNDLAIANRDALLTPSLKVSLRTLAIVPNHLDQAAAPAPEDEKRAAYRIALQGLLYH
jgi:hypothetical protein